MKSQKGFTSIEILIALAILVVVVGGGVLIWQNELSPAPTPISTPYVSPSRAWQISPVQRQRPTSSPSVNIQGDPYTWPVEKVCVPRCDPPGAWCPETSVVKDLGDRTLIYRRNDGTLFRGNVNECDCLPPQTLIDTPKGEVEIVKLKEGNLVWTIDKSGNKTSKPVVKVGKVKVPDSHKVVTLVLEDGREIFASPGHPTADGKTLGQLLPGDILDGSRVVSVKLIPYRVNYTYDILPAGETGLYWANGVLLKSTLPK